MDATSYDLHIHRRVVSIPTKFTGKIEHGEPIKNIHDALHIAYQEAQEMGVDTSYDDWCTYTSDEEYIYISWEVPSSVRNEKRSQA